MGDVEDAAKPAVRRKPWLAAVGIALILAGSVLAWLIQTSGGVRVADVRFAGTGGLTMSALLYIPPNATPQTPAPGAAPGEAEDSGRPWSDRFAALLSERGIRPISYADWLKIETAERELAASLGRGARVKLASRADIHAACGLTRP